MNDNLAALLYLLGRHVTTALRVRRDDEELVLSRRHAPPLRRLHEALRRGEQIGIDPWVEREDGTRGLVCLWAHTACPEVTADDLPAALRPHVWIRQGESALAVWLLPEPTGRPGGTDPAVAMREVAAVLGIHSADLRDYLPVPADLGDVVIADAGRSLDPATLIEWAQTVLAARCAAERERRERDEMAQRTMRLRLLVHALAAAADVRQRHEAGAPRGDTTIAAELEGSAVAEHGRSPEPEGPQPPETDTAFQAAISAPIRSEGDPLAILPSHVDALTLPTGAMAAAALEPARDDARVGDITESVLPHAYQRAALQARADGERVIDAPAFARLDAALADARATGWDEAHMRAVLADAMAERGTRDVWAALGVTLTWLRDGALYGLCGVRWVPLKDVAAGVSERPRP